MQTKKWMVREVDRGLQEVLVKEVGISPILANLLINRGYHDPQEVREFLNPDLSQLSSPFEMLNMGAVVERILQAVADGEKIVVYGDYDVDGICASVILYQGLKALHADVAYYVPDRLEEGYGVNLQAMKTIFEMGTGLVVTVDCGISSAAEVEEAKRWGMDVIVTDHHQLPVILPDCMIINPVLTATDASRWKDLCGAGVAFKLVQGLFSVYYHEEGFTERMRPYLDLAALATVADIVALQGDNRILVKFGLEEMAKGQRLGLRALWQIAQNGEDTAPDTVSVGFGIAPRLNACGRIGDVRLGLELLLTDDEEEARCIAHQLDEENRNRQGIERLIFEEALEQVLRSTDNIQYGLIVVGEQWHPGVIGIVASRLVERFYTPTIVLTYTNGIYKGSGRSIEGFHLQQALSECADLLLSFGGHSQAAGLSIAAENLTAFRGRFAQVVEKHTTSDSFMPSLWIDSEITLNDINKEIYQEICKIQPTGTMNPQPVFVCRGQTTIETRTVGSNGDHLRIKLRGSQGDIFGIGFKKAELEPVVQQGSVDIAFHLDKNVFNGKTSLQMLICDIKSYRRPDQMGMVDRLFFYSEEYLKEHPYKNLAKQDKFYTKVVGVTFEDRQSSLAKLTMGQQLELRHECINPHDENAVAVYAGTEKIGYLKRNMAKSLAPNFDKGVAYTAMVSQITGGGDQHFGVNVFIKRLNAEQETERLVAHHNKEALRQLDDECLLQRIKMAVIGENEYREKQAKTLQHLLRGENVLAVLGAGRGKSAIFQAYSAYLALRRHQCTVIIYPLRALVHDQLQSLKKRLLPLGINIQMGTGALEGEARAEFFQQIAQGELDIILTTPEFFACHYKRFQALGARLGLVVIDEAHHLASHRRGYKQLPYVLEQITPVQILAVTATANEQTADFILSNLSIESRVVDQYVRENLQLIDRRETNEKLDYLLHVIGQGEKTVIYVNSRQKVVKLAEALREKCPAALQPLICYYHGGLSTTDRTEVENAFRSGSLQVIVTTSAFGEDIDIADVRHVVLYHLSFSSEEYKQLAGRAGRDGKRAYVHLLYNHRDENLNLNLLQSTCPSRENLGKFYHLLLRLIQGKPAIDLTNGEIAELAMREKIPGVSESSVSHWLGVFEELDFLYREREGSNRRIIMAPNPNKVNLENSLRYQESLAELEDFKKYLDLAFDRNQDNLLAAINRPIFPSSWLSDGGGAND